MIDSANKWQRNGKQTKQHPAGLRQEATASEVSMGLGPEVVQVVQHRLTVFRSWRHHKQQGNFYTCADMFDIYYPILDVQTQILSTYF